MHVATEAFPNFKESFPAQYYREYSTWRNTSSVTRVGMEQYERFLATIILSGIHNIITTIEPNNTK